MENDSNLSDTDLIYVGEEHIDLDDSIHISLVDDLVIEQDQFCELNDADMINEGDDFRSNSEIKDDKDLSSGKVEGLMIVDEWDDEDMNSDDEKEDFSEKEKDAMNPEDIEKAMLSMPTMKVLMDDIGHMKQNRKVIVYPLTLEDFNAPQIQDILTWSALEETKINYTRSYKDTKVMVGLMFLHFTTSGSANKAMEIFKTWRDDLEVKADTNIYKLAEDFISDSRGKKRWTDNVAILKNLADDVKVESVRELFPQAEEVILHLESSKHKDNNPSKDAPSVGSGSVMSSNLPTPRGYAYLIFPSDEVVNAEVTEAAANRLELSGHRLLLLNYRNPVNTVPRAYLRLRERKVIMRHLDKCLKMLDKANVDPSVKLPEHVGERIELCKSLIEKDDKCRKEMELPEPSLEELKRMSGLPILDNASCHKILMRFGILKERKKRSATPQNDKRKERSVNSARSSNRGGAFRRKSPMRTGRRSPYGGNKRTRGSDNYRRSRNVNSLNKKTLPPSLMGSNPGLINPLALMMQQNLGMIGGGGVLNPNLMVQPNVNLGSSMLGSQAMPCIGGGGENGRSKILRLDETGTYHTADDFRHPSRYNDNMRRSGGNDLASRNFPKRKRSPSPRLRQDYDMLTSKARSNIDDGISPPLNLLLNLSHILQGIDHSTSRHHNIEKGKRLSYDRDYRGNQR